MLLTVYVHRERPAPRVGSCCTRRCATTCIATRTPVDILPQLRRDRCFCNRHVLPSGFLRLSPKTATTLVPMSTRTKEVCPLEDGGGVGCCSPRKNPCPWQYLVGINRDMKKKIYSAYTWFDASGREKYKILTLLKGVQDSFVSTPYYLNWSERKNISDHGDRWTI